MNQATEFLTTKRMLTLISELHKHCRQMTFLEIEKQVEI